MSESDITQASQEEEALENRGGSSRMVNLARQLVQTLEGSAVGVWSQGTDETRAGPATISTYSGGTEDHSPSSLHVGVIFGIVIIGIVLIVTLLLLLCKAIKSTYPQMHTNWTADIFRHHTNEGRRKSRSVVNHSTKQKHQVCTSSRPDFQLVVREQKLCGSHSHNPRNENQSSFALLKSAAPDDQYKSSLQEKPPPAYSEVIQSSAYPSHFTNQQTINGTLHQHL